MNFTFKILVTMAVATPAISLAIRSNNATTSDGALLGLDISFEIDESIAPKDQALNRLSYLFGWQMAGYSSDADSAKLACDDISSIGNGKWARIGLNSEKIKEPLCRASQRGPSVENSRINSIRYNTKLFNLHLRNAFKGKKEYAYLCENLDYRMMDNFPITSDAIIATICREAGVPTPPRSFESPKSVNASAFEAARNTRSILFANMYAAGATTCAQLRQNCKYAGKNLRKLRAQQLNGRAVQKAMCAIKEPISVNEARSSIVSLTTRYFTTVMEMSSGSKNWLKWLCEHADIGKMNEVGLNGGGVQLQFCADAKAGPFTPTASSRTLNG